MRRLVGTKEVDMSFVRLGWMIAVVLLALSGTAFADPPLMAI
jgi:hypothetical protein